MADMRITLFLLTLSAALAVLLLVFGGEFLATVLVVLLLLALPVFAIEALLTLGGALRFFSSGNNK